MSSTFSASATTTLDLEGVWLHLPDDPDGTARNYRYGKALRSASLDVAHSENQYAGRAYPVVDFGPYEREQVNGRAQVPYGPDWPADLAALKTFTRARRAVFYRDGRGRALLGTLSGHAERDEVYGTEVQFTVGRVEE